MAEGLKGRIPMVYRDAMTCYWRSERRVNRKKKVNLRVGLQSTWLFRKVRLAQTLSL